MADIDAAAAAPAARGSREASVPTAVAAENPLPPKAATTTLELLAPSADSSPAVVHPTSGTSGAFSAIPLTSWSRS
jgi:hypothetical protein